MKKIIKNIKNMFLNFYKKNIKKCFNIYAVNRCYSIGFPYKWRYIWSFPFNIHCHYCNTDSLNKRQNIKSAPSLI